MPSHNNPVHCCSLRFPHGAALRPDASHTAQKTIHSHHSNTYSSLAAVSCANPVTHASGAARPTGSGDILKRIAHRLSAQL
ncbi:hypothetical protein GCM10011507_09590 [Edaphobacter acidisoli]|uniref:Uncharacterized protein n=1 Tax=Edaphobacter acidisoli TaxID=2040573 RepID=A0A916W1P0_9BACT|nr:hypothetical protein GCM10011507_09590 [Edaphobacter acidisoli]